MKTHTATPYYLSECESDDPETQEDCLGVYGNGFCLIPNILKEDAQFIVTACNSHDQLTEALKQLVCVVECNNNSEYRQKVLKNAKEAISKAEGKE